MRLKENFFESDSMILLESMQDGYLYSNILLKLYLRSLKDEGRLMLNGRIPYNPQMLANVTRQQVGTVEKALEIFKELGLIEILDNGAIYMLDIQNFIGESSSEADRKRNYRERICLESSARDDEGQMSGQTVGQMTGQKGTRVRDRDREKERDKDIDIVRDRERDRDMQGKGEEEIPDKTLTNQPTFDEVKKFIFERGNKINAERFYDYYSANGWSFTKTGEQIKNWKALVKTWEKSEKREKLQESSEPDKSYDLEEFLNANIKWSGNSCGRQA